MTRLLSYSEAVKFETYEERLQYLSLWKSKHQSPRTISEKFYKNRIWLSCRESIIKRDIAFDLGVFGKYITGPIYVHHINPITQKDIDEWSDKLLDPENLISCSHNTHMGIHYKPVEPFVERSPGDTKLW